VPSQRLSLPLGSSERSGRRVPLGPVHIPRAPLPDTRPGEAPCFRGHPVKRGTVTDYSVSKNEVSVEIKIRNAVGIQSFLWQICRYA
jgi:hypothetical protein